MSLEFGEKSWEQRFFEKQRQWFFWKFSPAFATIFFTVTPSVVEGQCDKKVFSLNQV